MGLTALDLIFRLEKQFGIRISKAEAPAVLFDTAGTIHGYLVAKLKGEYRRAPRLEPLFGDVSRAVNRVKKTWRFTPDLNRRFSPATRAEQWQALERSLGVSLPQLEQPANEAFPRIPRQCESVVSLTNWIAKNHPERVEWLTIDCERTGNAATHQWSDEEVWRLLRKCIADALGVKLKEVTPEARMVEDMGMD